MSVAQMTMDERINGEDHSWILVSTRSTAGGGFAEASLLFKNLNGGITKEIHFSRLPYWLLNDPDAMKNAALKALLEGRSYVGHDDIPSSSKAREVFGR